MKTGNTLRTAKNSLLCFFMTLAGGFLVACGSSSDGSGVARPGTPALSVTVTAPPSFSAYLVDTAVEGVSVSGPTGDGVTGEGGVFSASDGGMFEFSIGGTTLGSVQMSSNQADNEVTPADFIGVNEAQVITIARILQALDADVSDLGLRNGISISQAARDDQEGVSALKVLAGNTDDERESVAVGGVNTYTLPSADNARDHLVATRKCLFSGGYVGDFEGTLSDDTATSGQSYYAVEPFVNRARMFATAGDGGFRLFETSTVGVIGSTITLSPGNELSFITPRLVAGVWQYTDDDGNVTSSGTENLTLAAGTGNPGATRRIVGFETTNMVTVAGMYVLDYFEGATVFRGRHYEVDATSGSVSVSSMPLSLTIVNSASWPVSADRASNGMTTVTLTLSGMRGEEAASITLGIVRAESLENANENYGSFEGVGNDLSGTWCDIGGAVGSTEAPTPPTPVNAPNADTVIEITWDAVLGATVYNLYLSTVSVGSTSVGATVSVAISGTTYMHDRPSADTEYFYQLEACNSAGCSERSDEVRTPPPLPPVVAGQCVVGQRLMAGESCTWREMTFEVNSGGSSATFGDDSADLDFDDSRIDEYLFNFFNGGRFAVERIDGTVWEITQLR